MKEKFTLNETTIAYFGAGFLLHFVDTETNKWFYRDQVQGDINVCRKYDVNRKHLIP